MPDDLEAQLRRYADHVEEQVGEIDVPAAAAPPRARRWGLALAVAGAVVIALGLFSFLGGDDEPSGFADDPDVVVGDDEPEPESAPTEDDAPVDDAGDDGAEPGEDQPDPVMDGPLADRTFPPAPIAPRTGPVVLGTESTVLVWGGVDDGGAWLADGAFLDLDSNTWEDLVPGPVAAAPFGAILPDDRFVYGAGTLVQILDPASGIVTLPPAPFAVESITVGPTIVVSAGTEISSYDLTDPDAGWTAPWSGTDADPTIGSDTEIVWNHRADDVVGVAQNTDGLVVLGFEPDRAVGSILTGVPAGLPLDTGDFDAAVVGSGDDARLAIAHEIGVLVVFDPDFGGVAPQTIRSLTDPRPRTGVEVLAAGDIALVQIAENLVVATEDRTISTLTTAFIRDVQVSSGPNGVAWWQFGGVDPIKPGTDLVGADIGALGSDVVAPSVGRVVVDPEVVTRLVEWDISGRGESITFEFRDPVVTCRIDYWWSTAGGEPAGTAVVFSDGVAGVDCTDDAVEPEVVEALFHSVDSVGDADGFVRIPVVVDLMADVAIQTLRNAGFDIVTVFEVVPADSPLSGRVVSQDPEGGGAAEVGSVITLTVGEAAPEEAGGGAVLCAALPEFPGGEPAHGSVFFGDAWPVLDDDLVLADEFTVMAFNDGELRGVLLATDFAGAVHVDGAGGLVYQDRFGQIVHAAADETLTVLADDPDFIVGFPGMELHGTAEIDGRWHAFAIDGGETETDDFVGELVILPIGGGEATAVGDVIRGNSSARPDWDGEQFILTWGHALEAWITGLSLDGAAVDLPWNDLTEPTTYEDQTLLVGAHGWQAYRGELDADGQMIVLGFDARSGDVVYPARILELGPELTDVSILPLEDRLIVSALTPAGWCTRIVGPDGSAEDVPFRGRASGPVGLYGVGD